MIQIAAIIRADRAERGTTKNLCEKDLAEHSFEFSGMSCLQTLVLLSLTQIALKTFGRVRVGLLAL